MWWPDQFSVNARLTAAAALALVLGGCFQPMYGDAPIFGRTSLRDALRDVEIAAVEGRVGQEIRNDIIFELTGGDGNPAGAPYRLNLTVSTGNLNPIIDPATGIPLVDFITLNVTYKLLDVAANKTVLSDTALARVSVDRSMQRFAQVRAVRDAENRAAKVVAQQIRSRLASYFLTRA
jgi:LPS-assembly lipoprotein